MFKHLGMQFVKSATDSQVIRQTIIIAIIIIIATNDVNMYQSYNKMLIC